MDYALLNGEDQQNLVLGRLRELEAHHFKFTLEEQEEPGVSELRTRSIADLERRISDYHQSLGLKKKMAGESPERGGDEVAEP